MKPGSAVNRLREKANLLRANVFGSGLSPHELSLTLCLGGAIGVMPLAWGSSLLCVAVAASLRLNQAALLSVSFLCYPLQIALFIPFCRLGLALLPSGDAAILAGPAGQLVSATGRALAAWSITVFPMVVLAYPLAKALLERRSGLFGQRKQCSSLSE